MSSIMAFYLLYAIIRFFIKNRRKLITTLGENSSSKQQFTGNSRTIDGAACRRVRVALPAIQPAREQGRSPPKKSQLHAAVHRQ
jgi:hypothetical protein